MKESKSKKDKSGTLFPRIKNLLDAEVELMNENDKRIKLSKVKPTLKKSDEMKNGPLEEKDYQGAN